MRFGTYAYRSCLLTRIKNNDPTLTSLNLSYQHLLVPDIAELVAALNDNPHIATLDITGNFLGMRALLY